jgi:disulfide bond formation protein DsbB
MYQFTNLFNVILSILFILGSFFFLYVFYLRIFDVELFKTLKNRYSIKFILFLSLFASLGSLIYSYVIGFPPCDLCWYQRIAIYPISILSFIAMVKKENISNINIYLLSLSVFGLIFAAIHSFIYYFGSSISICSSQVSCTTRYVFEFGFITIPLMSLLSFMFITLVLSKNKN